MALAPLCALDSSGVRRIPVVFLDAIRVAKVLFNSVAFHLSPSAVPFWHLSSSPPTASLDLFSAWLPAGSTNIAHIIHTTFSRHFAGHGWGRGDALIKMKFSSRLPQRECVRERERERERRERGKKVCSKQETQIYSLRSRELPGLDTFSLLRNSLGGIFTQPSPFGAHIHIAIHTIHGIHIDILSAVLYRRLRS